MHVHERLETITSQFQFHSRGDPAWQWDEVVRKLPKFNPPQADRKNVTNFWICWIYRFLRVVDGSICRSSSSSSSSLSSSSPPYQPDSLKHYCMNCTRFEWNLARAWGNCLPFDPLVRLALVDGTLDSLKCVVIAYQLYRMLDANVNKGTKTYNMPDDHLETARAARMAAELTFRHGSAVRR